MSTLFGWVRDKLHNLVGSRPQRNTTEEKVRAGPMGLKLPWFLPYFDEAVQGTGETTAMRQCYRRMLADPNVKAAVLGKILAVAGLTLRIQPASKTSQRDRGIADFIHWNLTRRISGGLPQLVLDILLGALVDGYSINEKVWCLEDKAPEWKMKWVLRDLKAKDVNRDAVLEVDEFRNITGVRGYRYNAGETYDTKNFVIYSHLKLYENPGGMSDFRAVYSRYWLMDTVLKLRAMGLEKRSIPLLKGEYTAPGQRKSLEDSLEQVKFRNWMSVPQGVRVEAVNLAGSSQSEFAEAIHDLREDIFLGIQGALLQALTGGAGQQRGASAVHKDTADLFKWHLSAVIEAILNDRETGLIPDMVDRNYRGADYPWATMSGVDEAELEESLRVDQGLHGLGLDLSKEELYEKYGRSPPKDDEDKLAGQAAPGGAPGGPGSPGNMGGGPFGFEEAFCDQGVNAGKPGPCPAESVGWLERAKKVPRAALNAAMSKVKAHYSSLSSRYGPRYAKAIIGAGLAGVPVPLPGASLLTAAPVMAVAELHRRLSGRSIPHGENGIRLESEQVRELGKAFMESVQGDKEDFSADGTVSIFTKKPSLFEAAELRGLDRFAAKQKYTGEKKDSRGRRICYEQGKRVKCSPVPGEASGKKKTEKAPKPDPADMVREAQQAWSSRDQEALGRVSEKIREAAGQRGGLGVAGLRSIAHAIGVQGSVTGAKKASLAESILDHLDLGGKKAGLHDVRDRLARIRAAEVGTGVSFKDRLINGVIAFGGGGSEGHPFDRKEYDEAIAHLMSRKKGESPKPSVVEYLKTVRGNAARQLADGSIGNRQMETILSGLAENGYGTIRPEELQDYLAGSLEKKAEDKIKEAEPGNVIPDDIKLAPAAKKRMKKEPAKQEDYIDRLRRPVSVRLDDIRQREEASKTPFLTRAIQGIIAHPDLRVAGQGAYEKALQNIIEAKPGESRSEDHAAVDRFVGAVLERVKDQTREDAIDPRIVGEVLEGLDAERHGSLRADEFIKMTSKIGLHNRDRFLDPKVMAKTLVSKHAEKPAERKPPRRSSNIAKARARRVA